MLRCTATAVVIAEKWRALSSIVQKTQVITSFTLQSKAFDIQNESLRFKLVTAMYYRHHSITPTGKSKLKIKFIQHCAIFSGCNARCLRLTS